MNEKLLRNNPGPFSNFLLNNNSSKMRSDKSKKINKNNKGMAGKNPNIKLVDSNASNKLKIKNDSPSINDIVIKVLILRVLQMNLKILKVMKSDE